MSVLSSAGRQILGSQLRRNMAAGVAMMVLNVGIMAVSYPVYLHYLGYEKYGVWLVLTAVLTFMQMGGNLGLGPAVAKLVAEEYGRENTRGIQSYAMMALAILTLSATLGLALILTFRAPIVQAFKLTGDNADLALRLLPYVGVLCIYAFLLSVLNATLAGVGRMDLQGYCETLARVLTLGTSLLLLRRGNGIASLLIGNVVSYAIMHVVVVVLIRWIVPVRLLRPQNWDTGRLKRLLSFGTGIMGGSFLNMLLGPFNKLMISRYIGVSALPIYDISYAASMQARNVVEAGLRALMPEMSRLKADTSAAAADRIRSIYGRATRLVLLCGLPLLAGATGIIAWTPLLHLWLREKFVAELPGVMCIMLLGSMLSLVAVPPYYTLMGLGRIRQVVYSHVLLSGANVALLIMVRVVLGRLSLVDLAGVMVVAIAISMVYLLHERRRLFQRLFLTMHDSDPRGPERQERIAQQDEHKPSDREALSRAR
jgi:O-antigen/teichoic acid export membrane protein